MVHLYQSAFMEALGWSLVDSLWKTGSLWLMYIIITGNGKWHKAPIRYFLAVVLMIIGTAWSFTSIPGYYHEIILGEDLSSPAAYFKLGTGGFVLAEWLMPWISTAYVCLIPLLFMRMIYQYIAVKYSVKKDLFPAGDQVLHSLAGLKGRIGIGKNIRIYFSNFISTPVTMGFIKPLILLPVAMLNQLTIEQTESVIAHELIHIRRNDYLLNILISVAGVMLFFNPFAALLRKIIQEERENACDDKVMALGFDRWQYAHALYTLGKCDSRPVSFAMAATGARPLLLERVKRILRVAAPKRSLKEVSGSVVKPAVIFFLCLATNVFFKINPVKKNFETETPGMVVRVSNTGRAPQTGPITVDNVLRKEVIIVKIKSKKVSGKVGKRPSGSLRNDDISITQASPPPPLPPIIINTFVSSARQQPDFTLAVPQDQEIIPEISVQLNTIVPYVPSSTFYYSNVEAGRKGGGRKTVHL